MAGKLSRTARQVLLVAALVGAASHCNRSTASSAGDAQAPGSTTPLSRSTPRPDAGPQPAAPTAAASSASPAPAPAVLDTSAYGWHADSSCDALPAVDHLEDRLAPPAGFARIPLEPKSFGVWLRRLPLAARDTPVRAYDGRVLMRADHGNVAAVTTLDVGHADLQQCADAVMRLHAEWAWGQGKRDMSYRAAAGTALPFARWAAGERVKLEGRSLRWVPSGRAGDDHASLRKYLDAVFSWSNTVALERQAEPVPLAELRPGDFLILGGNPGHTVLVLDLARAADGRRVVLLGQSYMPAQSFQVLRPAADTTWFTIDPAEEGVQTPFWPAPFPWSSLRRLDG